MQTENKQCNVPLSNYRKHTHARLPPPSLPPCVRAGEERWDIRMTAWLLYVLDVERQKCAEGELRADGASLWGQYLALLPQEREMCCLLNYTPEEARELQLPQLIVSGRMYVCEIGCVCVRVCMCVRMDCQ